jgi:hypothetical protein
MKESLIAVISCLIALVLIFGIAEITDLMEKYPEEVLVASEKDGNVLVEVLYDKYDNIIQKTTRDEITGMTIIYTFTYEQQNGYHVCVASDITILDSDGSIIKD